MKTFIFPGQGAQSKGMGGDLFDQFADLTASADAILGYSIKTLCLDDPDNQLGQTQFTQPALYVVNALSYYKKIADGEGQPDFVAGHSLGEFNALLAAECFSFEDGLRLVKKRGELMSQVSGGGMAAIINASQKEIETILASNGLTTIDLANFNTAKQIVISGMKTDIDQAEGLFQRDMMQFHRLNTSGAFHSRYMQPSQQQFSEYLQGFQLAEPKIPVIANVTGQPYRHNELSQHLASQIASAVKWCDSIHYLMAADSTGNMVFEEVGHGRILSNMIGKIRREMAQKLKELSQPSSPAPVAPAYVNGQVNGQMNGQLNGKAQQPQVATPTASPAPAPATTSVSAPVALGDTAQIQVANWNAKYGIGTKVKSLVVDYPDLQTRTQAMVLFGHRAAVYMKDHNGYFDLNEVVAIVSE